MKYKDLQDSNEYRKQRKKLFRAATSHEWLLREPSFSQSELIDRAQQSRSQRFSSSSSERSEMVVPRTFVDYFKNLYTEAHEIMVSRQASYGPANVEHLGPQGVFSRMAMDKVNRIARAMNGKIVEGKVELEPGWYTPEVHDALIDTINYAAILIALGQEKWSSVSRGEE